MIGDRILLNRIRYGRGVFNDLKYRKVYEEGNYFRGEYSILKIIELK